MANIVIILTNGTTADANEVMSNTNEIYTNIDNTNIAAGAGIAWSKSEALPENQILVGSAGNVATPSATLPAVALPTHTHADAANGGQLVIDNAVAGGNKTGTGSVVLAQSPTIVTPTVASFVNMAHDHQDAAGGSALNTAAITAGTFADARIAQNNVIQHQAAIDHAALSNLAVGDPHPQYSTEASPVFTGIVSFGNDVFKESFAQTTNNAANTPSWTYTLADDDSVVIAVAYVCAVDAAGGAVKTLAHFGQGNRNGGGAVVIDTPHIAVGGGSQTLLFTASGNDIVLNVAGIGGTNVKWTGWVEWSYVNN